MHSTMPFDQCSGWRAKMLIDPAATRPYATAEMPPPMAMGMQAAK